VATGNPAVVEPTSLLRPETLRPYLSIGLLLFTAGGIIFLLFEIASGKDVRLSVLAKGMNGMSIKKPGKAKLFIHIYNKLSGFC
jgi:hypothetical protein